MLLMLGAWFTDRIGVHSVFGAFILGTAVPRGRLSQELQRSIGPVTLGSSCRSISSTRGCTHGSGWSTRPSLWLVTLAIFAVACVGKGAACLRRPG